MEGQAALEAAREEGQRHVGGGAEKRSAHDEDEADVADDEEGLLPVCVKDAGDGAIDDADCDLAEEAGVEQAVGSRAGDLDEVEEGDDDG